MGANQATTPLGDMGVEAVEQNFQARNVEDIADQDTLAFQGKNCCAATKHRNIGVVSYLD